MQDAPAQPRPLRITAVSDAKFWARTRPEGDCIVWTGYRDRQGYGTLLRKFVAPSPMLAHRYAWYLTHGELPGRAVIRHSCDNPPCVNPDHLLTGTQADNIADRQARGRHRPGRLNGEEHPGHKVTGDQVLEMRRRWRDGESIVSITKDYPLSYHTVWQILHGNLWPHLPLNGELAA